MTLQLQEFQSRVFGQNGLARANKWVATVYPPRGITATGNALGNLLSGGNKVNINLPIFDAVDSAVDQLNNLNIDLGNINVGTNFAIPTLGYALANLNDRDRTLNLFCAGVTTPSRDVEQFTWKEYGEVRAHGFNHVYDDLILEYYCSNDLREKRFFEQWTDLIFSNTSGAVAYYEDFVSRVDVAQYNWQFTRKTAEYRFYEAWPVSVSGFTYTHDNSEFLKLQISMRFRKFERIS